jgi:hypothetical protein
MRRRRHVSNFHWRDTLEAERTVIREKWLREFNVGFFGPLTDASRRGSFCDLRRLQDTGGLSR